MRKIKINTDIINTAAKERGMTAEKYMTRIATLSFGQKVCAHWEGDKNGESIFAIFSVRTPKGH